MSDFVKFANHFRIIPWLYELRKECNQVTLYHAADVPLLALQHRNLKCKQTNASLRRSLEQRSVHQFQLPRPLGYWTLWTIPTTRKKQYKSISPKARWPQNWKTVWTAEMLLLTHLNFGEIIGSVTPVYLKLLSRRFLHRKARQALNEFLAWLVIF